MNKKIEELIRMFVKFGLVGIINTGLSFLVYTVLIVLGMYYILASSIGYLTGVLTGYLLSSHFVFKSRRNVESGVKFISVYLTSFFLNILYMYLFVDIVHINKLIAQLVAIGLNLVFNFGMSKIWVFKQT